MLRTSSHDRAAEALLAGEFLHSTHAADRAQRPSCFDLLSIAIHRETGTQAHEVAAHVASQLGWHLCDHELVERIAQRLQVPVAVVEEHDERAAHWLEDTVAMMSSAPVVRESHYVRQLVEATLELASAAHCVFVGRGAAWILPPEGSLRVALLAPLEHRIHVTMRERGLSASDAANAIEIQDRQRTRFSKAHFCHGEIDPHHFDVVLNTARLSLDDCAGLIIEAARDRMQSLERHLLGS